MAIKITRRDLVWSYTSYILQTSSGIFLLPIILIKLSSSELAIWYVFLAISALVNLLDFGFRPTIMRNISYIFSGARKLSKEGVIVQHKELDVDYSLLKTMILTVKRLYIIISICIAIIMLTLGSFYISNITIDLSNKSEILIAWYIYVISIILNFYFYYYTSLLMGRGKIAESNQTIVMAKIAFLLVSTLGLFLGYGLIAVAVGNLISSLVNRISSFYFFYDKHIKLQLKRAELETVNLFPILWGNAYKLGLVALGSFLINKGNTLIASNYLTLDDVAAYGLTLQLIMLLATISSVFFRTYLPSFTNSRMIDDIESIKRNFGKSLVVMNLIYLFGSLLILAAGNKMLLLLGSNTLLLSNLQMFVLLIIIYLEINHSNCATLITTKNTVPFVKSALISGGSILILALISTALLNFGLWGLILVQGIVQASYNNWKWPLEVSKDLKTNILELILTGCAQLKKTIIRTSKV